MLRVGCNRILSGEWNGGGVFGGHRAWLDAGDH
jgi:hypothetical protein